MLRLVRPAVVVVVEVWWNVCHVSSLERRSVVSGCVIASQGLKPRNGWRRGEQGPVDMSNDVRGGSK